MWFLLKLFPLVVASLFMHNICKDKIDNYLLLSQQQSVYGLPHVSDVAVLNDESGLLIGHVLNISKALVTSSLHHNSVYLPSNTSVDYLPLTGESYNYDNMFNDVYDDQCYVTDVLAYRITNECSTQPIEESNVYLPSTNYIDYLLFTNESYNNDNEFNDKCHVIDVLSPYELSIQFAYTNDLTPYPNNSLLNVVTNTTRTDYKEIHHCIYGTKETYDYIYQQLESYLPSHVYKELVNEYHVLSMEYKRRQQNDLLKAVWKQNANIYINKIKLFTRQTNSLLWKLSITSYNSFQNCIYGTEETYDYIYQQLESNLPLYIYKELVNEYHVLALEYQQRQQNDLSKPSWKQASNIYINKIKIFTRQTNSLLWKLLQHTVNCVKYFTESTIDYLNHLYILIVDYISSLFTIFKMAVRSIDFQLRDFLYLNVFLLVIYETKKKNKNQLVHLTKYYEKEMASMEALLQTKTNGLKQNIEKMEKEKIKEKLRSDNLMIEQQKKYEKLLKRMNSRPPLPLHLQPPPPPPPLVLQQNLLRKANDSLAPVNRPTITLHALSQSVSPIALSTAPINMQRGKIDSLQFFGCPDNYTCPTIRVN